MDGSTAIQVSDDDVDEDARGADSNFARNAQWAKPADSYQTALPPPQEKQFQGWVKQNNVPFDSSPQADYDMRGFWQGLQSGNPIAKQAIDPNDGKIHYPDYWKTPYHATFSNESKWAAPGAPSWNSKDQLVTPSGEVLFDDRNHMADGGTPGQSQASGLPDDLISLPPTNQAQSEGLPDDLIPLGKPTDTMPGVVTALGHGIKAGLGSFSSLGTAIEHGKPAEQAPEGPEAQPLTFGDLRHPISEALPKAAYELGAGAPGMAGAVVGGAAGSLVGPLGTIAGTALGAGAVTMAQTLGPLYGEEYKKTPEDPDGAFDRAMGRAATEGGISGAGFAAFGLAPFKGAVKNLVFQAFGVQPTIGMAGQAAQNVETGKPVGENVAEQYLPAAVGTALPMAAHAIGSRLVGAAKPAEPSTEPPGGSNPDDFPPQRPVNPTSPAPTMQAARDAAAPAPPASGSPIEPRYDPESQTYGLATQDGTLLHTGYASAEDAENAATTANASGIQPRAPEPEGPTRESVHQDALDADIEPTDAQKEAGNYAKGHTQIHGMDVSIENPAGSVRTGMDADGNRWEATMPDDTHYGYINRTEGADGDHVDAFIGPNPQSRNAYVIDQIDPATGKFDEHKSLIGFNSGPEAVDAYRKSFSDGSGDSRIGAVTPMPIEQFKDWLANGDTKAAVAYKAGEAAPDFHPVDSFRPQGPMPSFVTLGDSEAVTSTGRKIPTTYGLVDAADLATSHTDDLRENPNYPQTMQPRDRSRNATELQMNDMLNPGKFTPELLGESADAANGAPIVGADGVVESGNMRVMALRRAYADQMPAAQMYRDWLTRQGYPVGDMKSPVLVRLNRADMLPEEREAFAREANKPAQLAMSATEQAMADARSMPDWVMEQARPEDLLTAGNRGFVKSVLSHITSQAEMGKMIGPDGALSNDGLRRVQGAILAKAYGDPTIVQTLLESTDGNYKAIGAAMLDAAAPWAKMRAAASDGRIPPEFDITKNLTQAVGIISQARSEGRNVVEYVRQKDIFSGDAVPPETEGVLHWMLAGDDFTKRIGKDKIAEAMRYYADGASAVQPGPGLFGDEAKVRPADLITAAGERAQTKAPDRQPGLLEGDAASPGQHQDLMPEFEGYRNTSQHPADALGSNHVARAYVVERGKNTGNESMVAYDRNTGAVSHVVTSNEPGGVKFGPELETAARDPGNNLIIHHNHPRGTALSGPDIGAMASHPGIEWAVAHNHAGELSAARINPALRTKLLEIATKGHSAEGAMVALKYAGLRIREAHEAAARAVFDVLNKASKAGQITPSQADHAHSEIVNRALAKAGIIDYVTSRSLDSLAPEILDKATAAAEKSAMEWRDQAPVMKGITNDNANRRTIPVRFDEGLARLLGGDEAARVGRAGSEARPGDGQTGTGAPEAGRGDLLSDAAFQRLRQERADAQARVDAALARGPIRARFTNGEDAYTLTPSTTEGVEYQLTFFDKSGAPTGHIELNTKDLGQEVFRLLRQGYTTDLPEATERPLLNMPPATGEELAARQRQRDREAAEAGFKGRQVAAKPQKDAGDLPLFGGERQGRLFEDEDRYNPPFYSALERGIEAKGPNRAPVAQWDALIRNMPGVKTEERDWTGIHQWLSEQTGAVSKADLLQHLRENNVQVHEVMKGEPGPVPTNDEFENLHSWIFNTPGHSEEFSREADGALDSVLAGNRSGIGELEGLGVPDHLIDPYREWLNKGGDGTKFGTGPGAPLPGGKNYRELLLTLPEKQEAALNVVRHPEREGYALQHADGSYVMNPPGSFGEGHPTWWRDRDGAEKWGKPVTQRHEGQTFRGSHWDEPNVLAHVRFDDRTGPNGEKVLHVAEVQSDWHQKGKKGGYRTVGAPTFETQQIPGTEFYRVIARPANGGEPMEVTTGRLSHTEARHEAERLRQTGAQVPDAPFKTSWPDLAMKRMIRYAAENGYDRLSWDTGDTNADRYDLSKHVGQIWANKVDDNAFEMTVSGKDGGPIYDTGRTGPITLEKMSDTVGKDMAEKIANQSETTGKPVDLRGLDLKVGGEGMRGFYDRTLPNIANKIGKPFGAKVEPAHVSRSEVTGSHYEGPEPTPEQIESMRTASRNMGNIYDSPVTGERQMFPISRVAMQHGMDRVIRAMKSGKSFAEAMAVADQNEGAHDLAKAFGGDMVQDRNDIATPTHSIPITPEMRSGVLRGQALFEDRNPYASAAPGLIPEQPTNIPEGADYLDNVADAIGEQLKGKGTGTYARALKNAPPPEGANRFKDLNIVQRFSIFPRTLASQDTMFGRLWNRWKERTNTQNGLMDDYRHLIPTFLKMSEKQRNNIYAAEELDRIWSNKREDTGAPISWANTSAREAEFSKPGQKGVLSADETKAYFERRAMFQRAWTDIMEGTARKFGWEGPWTGDAGTDINAIMKAARDANHPAMRKQFQRTADLMVAMESQRRDGYAPLMRFGDYYIAVKPKAGTEELSPGGFPSVQRFELVERPALRDWLGGGHKQGAVPDYAKARIDELTKKYGDDFDIEHGYLYKKPDVIRNLDIPAVEKLLMLMEGNVRQSLKEQATMRPGDTSPVSGKDANARASEDWDRMYNGLLDTFRKQMYDEIKAGFKKRSRTVPGYSPDWDRTTGAYMHWTSRHVSDLLHGNEIEHAYNDIVDSHPYESVRQYTKKWRDYQEDPQGPFSHASNAAAQLGFAYTLAANPSSSIVIGMHGPVVGHATMSVGVGALRAGRALYGALGQMVSKIRADATRGLYIDHATLGSSPAERAFMATMHREGLLHSVGADDIRALNDKQSSLWGVSKPVMRKAMDIASSNITVVDQMNRAATALGAFRMASDPAILAKMNKAWAKNQVWRDMAQQKGVNPENMARFMLSEAAFEYGKAAAAPMMRGAGQMFFQLHGFQTRALSAMWKLTTGMGTPGRLAAGWIGAAIWATAGLEGLPFTQDVENAGDAMWKWLSGHDPMITYRLRGMLADSGFGKVGAEAVMRGPMGSLLGVDLANRVGFGDPISREMSGTDMIGTVPSILVSRIQGARLRAQKHQGALAVAAETMPAAIRNPMMAAVQAEQGVRTRKNEPIESASKVTPGQTARQAIGFRPTPVQRLYEANEYRYQVKNAHGPVPHNPIPGPNE